MEKGLESFIEAVAKELKAKRDFESRWCKQYEEGICEDKMRNYASTGHLCDNKCENCDKLKWVIDRAKEYAKICDSSYEEVLKAWEEDRDYWFLNYYQEANQPKPESEDVVVVDSIDEFKAKYKEFRCPYCKGISTHPTDCNSGVLVKLANAKGLNKCNWKAYGLIGGPYSVLIKDKMKSYKIFKPIALEEKENDF